MSIYWVMVWLAFLVYVSFRASQYYAKKRYGIAIALSFLALFVAYEVTMQWYGQSMLTPPAQTQSQETPDTMDVPELRADETPRPPSQPQMGPPPSPDEIADTPAPNPTP